MRQFTLRYDTTKIEPRIEALLPYLQADNEAVTVTISKAKVIILLEGLALLEKRHMGKE
jgi:hypothetical protein